MKANIIAYLGSVTINKSNLTDFCENEHLYSLLILSKTDATLLAVDSLVCYSVTCASEIVGYSIGQYI